jgi:hypothetical protein
MKEKNLYSDINAETSLIDNLAYKLLETSSALYATGNEILGEKLCKYSQDLIARSKKIMEILSEQINEDVNASVNNIGKVISAINNKGNNEN